MSSCIACDFPVSNDYFGHRITPFVLERLFDLPVARAGSGRPAVFGVGSDLSRMGDGAMVLGAGFKDESSEVPQSLKFAEVQGLRGRLSARMAAEAGIRLPNPVPIGNLCELLPEIIPRVSDPVHRFGVLPHSRDLGHAFSTSCEVNGGRLISPFADPESVIRSLHECTCVLTTSLEGLMICDAYGIPSRWIRIERPKEISDFSFRDYLSGRVSAPDGSVTVDQFWDFDSLIDGCQFNVPDPDRLGLTRASIEACRQRLPTRECGVSFLGDVERRSHPTPVFVISFNRLKCLTRLVESLQRSTHPIDLVIHDNGSDFPPLLAYLEALEKEGVLVTRNPKIGDDPRDLEQINDTISRYFEEYSEPVPFVVTDPDICFEGTDPAFLEVYREILNRFPGVKCVGPQLPIHDIPETFPLRDWVIHRQKNYWSRPPDQYLSWRGKDIYLRTNTVIDTTFALFRAGTRFKRLSRAIRVYGPYDARHLDWYESGDDDEDRHYRETSGSVSHWQGEYARMNRYQEFRLGPTTVFITEFDPSPSSAVKIRPVEI